VRSYAVVVVVEVVLVSCSSGGSSSSSTSTSSISSIRCSTRSGSDKPVVVVVVVIVVFVVLVVVVIVVVEVVAELVDSLRFNRLFGISPPTKACCPPTCRTSRNVSLLSNRLLLRPCNSNSVRTFNAIATSVTIANIADMVTTATIATMATIYNGNHYVGSHNSIAHSCRSPWCTTGLASCLHICLSSRRELETAECT